MKKDNNSSCKLLPVRHPERDFFTADIFDNLPYKDDTASMGVPIFSLSKKKDLRTIRYENKNINVLVSPSFEYGLPTIFDKDILLFCGSKLMEEVNKGIIPPKTIRTSIHDLLVSTNRIVSKEGYDLLEKALNRLSGVLVTTNIRTNDTEQVSAFHLLESFHFLKSNFIKDRRVGLEMTVSDWFYNSIIGKEVLTINPAYFRLGRAIERRLYEIARKHCGKQNKWVIKLSNLKDKVGSTGSLVKFRYYIKQISNDNYLPDYTISIEENDLIVFTHKKSNDKQESLPFDEMPNISYKTIEKAKQITHESGTGWDFHFLHQEFTLSLQNGFNPSNANGAFINFIKKKTKNAP